MTWSVSKNRTQFICTSSTKVDRSNISSRRLWSFDLIPCIKLSIRTLPKKKCTPQILFLLHRICIKQSYISIVQKYFRIPSKDSKEPWSKEPRFTSSYITVAFLAELGWDDRDRWSFPIRSWSWGEHGSYFPELMIMIVSDRGSYFRGL